MMNKVLELKSDKSKLIRALAPIERVLPGSSGAEAASSLVIESKVEKT